MVQGKGLRSCGFRPQRVGANLRRVQPTAGEPSATTSRGIFSADWFSPGRFAVLLALLVGATFPEVLSGAKTFVVRDYGFFAYPLAHFQRGAFLHGELPLWNPLNNCGVPFLAQWNTMPLYPPALLYLLPPLEWSLSFFCLAHLWFAGFGAYLLARRWTQNNFAAAFAGVAFAFNGLTLNLLMWPSHIATFAWMPWVVWLAERAWREGGKIIFLAALAGALQMLAGGPETILFTWLLLAALWVLDWVQAIRSVRSSRREEAHHKSEDQSLLTSAATAEKLVAWRQLMLRFPFIVLLVAALAAAQLLPFLDLVAHSQREAGYADSRWAMPLRGWANFFVPLAFGRVWNMGVFFQHGQAWTSSYYLGMATTLLGLLAVGRVRERRVWLLAGAALLALLFGFGDNLPPTRWLREMIPQLRLTTYPVKFTLLLAFLGPQLAAFGLAKLFSVPPESTSAPLSPSDGERVVVGRERGIQLSVAIFGAVMLALIAVILFWVWRAPMPNDDPRATLFNGAVRASFLVASVGWLLFLAKQQTKSLAAALVLLVVAWLDVFTHAPNQNPSVLPWVYEPGLARTKLKLQPPPLAGEGRVMVSPLAEKQFSQITTRDPADNLVAKRLGFFANCNLLDDVPKVNGFFSLYPREIGELMSALYGTTNWTATGLLDFLGVVQITAPEKFFEWQARTNTLPLLHAGAAPVFLDDTNALRALLFSDFDPRKNIILPPAARALVSATNASTARISGWRIQRERIECEVEVEQAALVSVAQTYYHRWRVFVDDRPANLLRANYAFQAVEVPPGKHRVRLIYQDRPFQVGAAISLVALAICLGGLVATRKRND